MLILDRIYVDWIVKKEKFIGIWDVFLMLWTLRGLGRDRVDVVKKDKVRIHHVRVSPS